MSDPCVQYPWVTPRRAIHCRAGYLYVWSLCAVSLGDTKTRTSHSLLARVSLCLYLHWYLISPLLGVYHRRRGVWSLATSTGAPLSGDVGNILNIEVKTWLPKNQYWAKNVSPILMMRRIATGLLAGQGDSQNKGNKQGEHFIWYFIVYQCPLK